MAKKTLVIGLAGEIASGKGTVAKYLAQHHHAVEYKFSNILGDILNRVHLDKNRENFTNLSIGLRKYYGQDILAHALAEDVKEASDNIIVVDGVRRKADLKYLRELDNFIFVFIAADVKARYERLTARSEKQDDRTKTFEQFQKDAELETERSIAQLRNIADVNISNDGTLDELYARVDKIIEDVE